MAQTTILSFPENEELIRDLCHLNEETTITYAHYFWVAIFHDIPIVRIRGKEYSLKRTTIQGLRYFEMEIGGRTHLFMEQNQNSKSSYAERARQGERIMWVMLPRNSATTKGSSYQAVYVNGRREK